MMEEGVQEIDEMKFDRLVKESGRLVVVEFYLTTCPHCAEIAPIYEEISKEMRDQAIFTKIDAQANIRLSSRFGIVGTPTFKFFCKDQLIGELVGAVNATVLRNTIRDIIRHQISCSTDRKMVYELDGYG